MGLAAQRRQLLGQGLLLLLARIQRRVQLLHPGLEGFHVGTGRRHGGLGLGALALDGFQLAAAGGQLLGGGARGVAGRLGTAAQVGQGLGKLQGCLLYTSRCV